MKHHYKFRGAYEHNARIKRQALKERSSQDVLREVADDVNETLQDEDVHHSIRNLK